MKIMTHAELTFALALLLLPASANAAPLKLDFINAGSQTYSNVTVLRVTETDVYFNHDKGVANIKLKYLDPELQAKLEYDPQMAAAAERRQSQDDWRFQGSLASNILTHAEHAARAAASSEDSLADAVSDKSLLGRRGPALQVTKWLGEKPELKGKAQLLYFWAPWSVPCRKTIPDVNALQKTFSEKLVVIGLASSTQPEIEAMADARTSFSSALDPGSKLRTAFGASSIPYVVLVDSKGVVRYEGHPAAITEKHLRLVLDWTAEKQGTIAKSDL